MPTSSTQELVKYALEAFRRAYRPEVLYKKSGVVLLQISNETDVMQDLFEERNREKFRRLQQAMDTINTRHGNRSLLLSTQMITNRPDLVSVYKHDHQSPRYTTDLRDVIIVKAT